MKFSKKRNRHETSNLWFSEELGEGRSYELYSIARRINGRLILNRYGFSNTTIRHIHKLRNLFKSLNLTWIEIEAPRGLQNLDLARAHYELRRASLLEEINRKGTKAHTNKAREIMRGEYLAKIHLVDSLQGAKGAE